MTDPFFTARAFAVHLLTASGAVLAFVALILATFGAWSAMFLTLGIALLVDGLDGPLARRWNVRERLPRWSGETLDLVVDFLTYVFVPAYAIAMSGLLPMAWAMICGVVIVMTSVLYFSDRQMKTTDDYFRGFPALWNVVAFYLLLLTPPVWASVTAILLLAAASFAPVTFVHPVRVTRWRTVTLAAIALWALLATAALWHGLAPGRWVTVALCVIAAYVVGVGLTRPTTRSEDD